MNYRHAFHAGGFADVVKHAVLALLIERLKQKDTAFRVIDTHAGTGLYDLTSNEATRSGEWRDGIGRLWQRDLAPALAASARPLAGGGEGGQRARRHAALLSRLAVDRPPSLPPAGPADRGRAAPGRRQALSPSSLPATSRCARSRSTAGWRSAPSCRPRSAAGWCWSTRPMRSRTSSPASPTASPTPMSAGRPASTRSGIR